MDKNSRIINLPIFGKKEGVVVNTVNEENFNDTKKGYLIRVLRIVEATEKCQQKIFQGIRWAVDEMTMRDARKEYEAYCQGEITFPVVEAE